MRAVAFLFDFDGVLVDSLPTHIEAWQSATKQLFRSELQRPHRFIGLSTKTISHIIAHEFGDPSAAQYLRAVKNQKLTEAPPPPLRGDISGVCGWLQNVRQPYGVASNAYRSYIEEVLRFHNLSIELVLGVEDAPKPKPAPDLYCLAATKLGIDRSKFDEVVVFEDSLHGITAGLEAGMKVIGVTSQHDGAKLRSHGAMSDCSEITVSQLRKLCSSDH